MSSGLWSSAPPGSEPWMAAKRGARAGVIEDALGERPALGGRQDQLGAGRAQGVEGLGDPRIGIAGEQAARAVVVAIGADGLVDAVVAEGRQQHVHDVLDRRPDQAGDVGRAIGIVTERGERGAAAGGDARQRVDQGAVEVEKDCRWEGHGRA